MKEEYKTKKQLIEELKEFRQRVDKLERMKKGRKRPEEALRWEHNLFSRIMETNPAGITVVDRQGKIAFANGQAEQVLGLKKDQITQLTYNAPEWRITDYDGNPFPDKELPFGQVMTTNQAVYDVRHAIEWPNGRRVLLSINAAPLFDDSGKFDGMVATVEDITERVRTEKELEESEEKYKKLVEESLQGIVIAQGLPPRLIFVNSVIAEMLGYKIDELISFSPEEVKRIIHPEDQAIFFQRYRDRLEGREVPSRYEIRGMRKDGTVRWGELIASRIEFQGKPAVHATFVDITERKKAEAQLRESEHLYRTLTQNSLTGIYMFREGRYLFANEMYCKISGYSWNDLKSMDPLNLIAPECREQISERVKKRFAGEDVPSDYETQIISKDGIVRDVHIKATRIIFEGKPTILGNIIDITEPKRVDDLIRTQHDLILALSAASELDEGLRLCMDAALHISEMDCGGVYLVGEASGALDLVFHKGLSPDFIRTVSHHNAESINARIVMTGKPTYTEYLKLGVPLDEPAGHEGLRAIAVLPVHYKDRVIGCLNVASHTLDEVPVFSRAALEAIAAQIGSSIVRLKTEGALKASEEKYRALVESSTEAILMLDRERKIVSCNQAFLDLFGYDKNETEGKSVRIIHPSDGSFKTFGDLAYSTIDKIGFFRGEWNFVRKDGLGFPAETVTSAIRSPDGLTIGFVAIMRDLTERKHAEAALQESEEKYRSLVANATDAIFIVQDGRIKFPNPITLTLAGYSEEELATIPFIDLIHPEDQAMVLNNYTRRLKGEEVPSTYTFRVIKKRGEELWGQLNAVLITWEGRPAILCFIRDITPQKRLEAQYLHAQKMEAVGTLAGGIAHDFNNLLQAVLGYTEILLLDKEKLEHGYQELQEIKRAAQRGGELTQRLLTFSRRVPSKLRPVNLNQEINQIQKLLQRTIPKMINIEITLADDLRTVNADPAQIEQALMNLAVNARDAMPERGKLMIGTKNITLDEKYCKMHLGVKPGEYVLLTVTDTGHGMDRETLGHLFEPFYTTKGVGRGTGLGLSMVYGIIKSHEGYIFCDSQIGKGTTFEIYLPIIEQRHEMEGFREERIPVGGKESILLIDDEESIRDLGSQILHQFGYTVLTASDGESGLELYGKERGKIDLVILDLIMPGMGGRRCLEELIKMDPKVKVVIASGYSVDGPTKEGLEIGAKNFVSKPYAMRQMLKVVREVLDQDA